MQINITCPDCKKGEVPIETNLFVAGAAFTCPQCKTELQLATESIPVAANGLEKYSAYREKMLELKEDGNRPDF